MLFSQDNDLDLFFALGGVVIGLMIVLRPAMSELGQPWGTLLAIAVAVPTVSNLLRYKSAPVGCAVVPLGFLLWVVAWQLGRTWTERALLLGAPNLVFYVWRTGWRPWRLRQLAQQALGALGGLGTTDELAPYLRHAASEVREAAASKLSERPPDEVLPALDPYLQGTEPEPRRAALRTLELLGDRGGDAARERLLALVSAEGVEARAAAEAATVLGSLGPSASAELHGDPRPEVRLGLAEGLRGRTPPAASEAAGLLVGVAGSPDAPEALRVAALEAGDVPSEACAGMWREAMRAALRGYAASAEGATAEVLWLLAEHGEPQDAPWAARFVSAGEYGLANAGVEALEQIFNRCDAQLGEAAHETHGLLRAAVASVREVHPAGDNRLADLLVERLEGLLAGLDYAAGEPESADRGAEQA
ncbi:MAG TPA: hypothetical protein DEA08_01420 [Planctomycetes bacterium]|nr:hypothetical protein [Planctomycetota bacterium]